MTKKDYISTADTLAKVHNNGDVDGIFNLLDAFSDMFKADNSSFDSVRFTEYAVSQMVFDTCPYYDEKVLPDEHGKCSLCGKHKA